MDENQNSTSGQSHKQHFNKYCFYNQITECHLRQNKLFCFQYSQHETYTSYPTCGKQNHLCCWKFNILINITEEFSLISHTTHIMKLKLAFCEIWQTVLSKIFEFFCLCCRTCTPWSIYGRPDFLWNQVQSEHCFNLIFQSPVRDLLLSAILT